MNTDATDPIHSETQGVAFTDSHKAGQHKLDETVPRKTVQRRIGAIIVFLVPVTAVFMTVIFFIKPEQQPALLRLIFLVAVCCFPALLYYLFIATKKNSLFNEFILNLNRLGLLYPKRLPQELICAGLEREEPRERETRIYTYMQKFEASYGAIPTDLGGLVLEPTNLSQGAMDLRMSDLNPKGFANILIV